MTPPVEHSPALRHRHQTAATALSLEVHARPREAEDRVQRSGESVFEELIPSEKAVRMVPALQAAFASLGNDPRDRGEQRERSVLAQQTRARGGLEGRVTAQVAQE